MTFLLVFLSALLALHSSSSFSMSHEELSTYLKNFHKNPATVMNKRLAKRDTTPKNNLTFSSEDQLALSSPKEIINARDLLRMKMLASVPENSNDRVEHFFENQNVIRSIRQLEAMGLRSSEAATTPWSDSYWPMYKGIIGNRYADPGFPGSLTWLNNHNYILANPAHMLIAQGQIERLSPAEKYDYFVGDGGFNLTQYVWNKGGRYQTDYGVVPGWMGICHGWAGAAIAYPQPLKRVDAIAANGSPVIFHPSDIKALASQIWAVAPGATRFVGGRCRVHNPERDPVGRVTDPECFNTNPGTWHLIATNQLGVAKKSFVMDATYDFEVWNHPVKSYKITYFNPQTLSPTERWQNASTSLGDFTIDKFKSFRAPETQNVVGVAMEVQYMIPLRASHNGGARHHTKAVTYVYDLELNSAGDIIGGEWYTNLHPDFVWTPTEGSRAVSSYDDHVQSNWEPNAPVAADVSSAAHAASQRGQPLGRIIEKLVQLSSTP